MCVQKLDGSLRSAIHTTCRISLRSSSMPEPRDPLLRVFFSLAFAVWTATLHRVLSCPLAGSPAGAEGLAAEATEGFGHGL